MNVAPDDDFLVQLCLTEPRIAKITQEAVAGALEGFRLKPVRSLAWITRAVQIHLRHSLTPADEGAGRQENKVTKRKLNAIARKLGSAWKALADLGPDETGAVFDYSWRIWRDPPMGLVAEPPAYKEFQSATAIVERLGLFLGEVAAALETQKANWKRALEREERIRRAHYLSTVFEEAFGEAATYNDWDGAPPSLWADFYQRIVSLVFAEHATPDLPAVLKAGARRHKSERVIFELGNVSD